MTVCIVPTNRPARSILPALWAVATQTTPPDRIVVIDDTQGGDYPLLQDDALAWFCLREEIRVINSAKLRLPAGVGGYERLAYLRPLAAQLVAEDEAVWFVDDDVLARPDCLERLFSCSLETGAQAVAASIEELFPHSPPYWPRHSWSYNHHHRPGSKLVGATGLGCTLVWQRTFCALAHCTVRPDIGLEDVVATAQLALMPGGVRVSGDARALHLRSQPAVWATESLGLGDLKAALLPAIREEGWGRLLPLIGEMA